MHAHPAYALAGFGAAYDRARPQPPEALLDLVCDLLGRRPRLVVDLGCGTGLSTVPWAGRAERVVGVEANPEMLRAARPGERVEYRQADAAATGLEDGCADVVTCSQSFHWMEPRPTLAEVARILLPGGVFAAYDYDLPPAIAPEVDAAFAALLAADETDCRGQKRRELAEVRASGRFRLAREVFVHGRDEWDAERVLAFALGLGQVSRRLLEEEPAARGAVERLREALGGRTLPVWWSYDVVVVVR